MLSLPMNVSEKGSYQVVDVDKVPKDMKIVDIGPKNSGVIYRNTNKM